MRRTAVLSAVLALGPVAGTAAVVPVAEAAPVVTSASAAPEVELPRPVRGANAVRLLGGQLDEAAARNDMSGAELTELLTTDPTAWIDTAGAVFFKEAVATAPADDPVSAQAPLSQTFQLHSNPASSTTIFLDFDGGTASGTSWHTSYPATPTTQPAWDTGGNAAVFDDAERTAIQTIWQSVAEDYAPFDVDVTTADPGPAKINRSSLADTAYGSHVLITPSVGAHDAICGGCGGVAYIDVFDAVSSGGGDGYGSYQPAWVFPQKLGNSPKNIAEAASHEVGHNFGLRHDGNAAQGYDTGHGAWAPIMGVGYDRAISQWSRGDYATATNQEDDVAIIRSVTGSRPDEAPSIVLDAPAPPAGTAYVGSRTDVDTYLLGTCSGTVSVVADPLASWADLDLQLTILDDLGHVVATHDPASVQTTTSTASGMGASLTRTLTSGTYYASVDGVGNGAWSTGYDDYGSLGSYTLAATGCDGTGGPAPTTTSLLATASGRTVTLTATPASDWGVLTGDVVFREGATVVGTMPLGTGSAVVVLASVAPGVHTYNATFVPSDTAAYVGSTSPGSTVTVARVATTTDLTTTASGRSVNLAVTVTSGSGVPAGAVELREGTTVLGTVPLSAGAASLTLADVAPGDHIYTATYAPTSTFHSGSTSPARTQRVDAPVVPPITPVPTPTPTPTADPVPTPPAAPTAPTAPTVSVSTTTLKAPTKAQAGTRPTITVMVRRGTAAAGGTVVVTVGKKSTTLTLTSGTGRLKLPRLKAGKLKITGRYTGNPTTAASTATSTIKVTG
jgi:hypothetical protein